MRWPPSLFEACLLYTSDAADERSSVDLGGRRIIKKKTKQPIRLTAYRQHNNANTTIQQNINIHHHE